MSKHSFNIARGARKQQPATLEDMKRMAEEVKQLF